MFQRYVFRLPDHGQHVERTQHAESATGIGGQVALTKLEIQQVLKLIETVPDFFRRASQTQPFNPEPELAIANDLIQPA